jgi:hypothetical protein
MGMVLLKSKVGAVDVKRTTRIEHERGYSYERVPYSWNFDNDFKCSMPADVWESLSSEYIDRKIGLRYKEAMQEL